MSNITSRDYYNHVESLAHDVIECVNEYGQDLSDALWECVDGSAWVIYTHRARKVIDYSDNDCLYFDEFGPIEVSDWTTLFTHAAFYALHADVSEKVAELMEAAAA